MPNERLIVIKASTVWKVGLIAAVVALGAAVVLNRDPPSSGVPQCVQGIELPAVLVYTPVDAVVTYTGEHFGDGVTLIVEARRYGKLVTTCDQLELLT